jgi:hypothetical protein
MGSELSIQMGRQRLKASAPCRLAAGKEGPPITRNVVGLYLIDYLLDRRGYVVEPLHTGQFARDAALLNIGY